MGLSLLATTDTQIIRVIEALYNQRPGYTLLTNYKTFVTENSLDSFANSLAASFTSSTDAELAAIVTGNLGLTGDVVTAGNAYLEGQFAANPAARGKVILDAMNALATLENDATYGAAAAAFNADVVGSLTYSSVTTNTSVTTSYVDASAGQAYALTSASTGDELIGTADADTFTAITTARLQTADVLDGGAGIDTLTAKINSTTAHDATMDGIEIINLTSVAAAAIDGANITGATNVNVTSAGYVTTYKSQDAEVFSISGAAAGLTVTRTATDTTTDAITVNLTSGALGTLTLGATNAGADYETFNLVVAGATKATLTEAGTPDFSASTDSIVVTGEGDIVLAIADAALGGHATKGSAVAATINASGHTGSLTLDLGLLETENVDLSKVTGVDIFKIETDDTDGDENQLFNLASGSEVIVSSIEAADNTLTLVPTATVSTADTLTVTLNHKTAGSEIDLTSVTVDGYETVTVNSTGTVGTSGVVATDAVKNIVDTIAGTSTDKNLVISGDMHLTAGVENTWTNIDITNTAGADLTIAAGTEVNVLGGAGDDRFEFATMSDLTANDAIDGAAGSDTLAITGGSNDLDASTFSTAQRTLISAGNFETLEFEGAQDITGGDAVQTLDLTKLSVNALKTTGLLTVDSVDILTVKALDGFTWTSSAEATNAGGTAGGAAYVLVDIKDALAGGTANTVNYIMGNTTAASADAGFTIDGVEILNVSVSGDFTSADVISLADVDGSALSTINITSTNTGAALATPVVSDSLTITDVESTIVSTLDASAFTGALTITGLSDNYMSSGATIKGGSGVNTITAGSGADIITTGKGADIILAGRGYDTIDSGAGADKVWAATGMDTTPEADSTVFSGTWASTDTVTATIAGIIITATGATTLAAAAAALETAIDANADLANLVTTTISTTTNANDTLAVEYIVDGNFTDIAFAASTNGSGAVSSIANIQGTASSDVDAVTLGTGADFVHTGGGIDTINLGVGDKALDTVYILSLSEGADVITGFEALTGSDVIKFAGDMFNNGTDTDTLQEVGATAAAIATTTAFVELTVAAAAGGVDTASEAATHIGTKLTLGNIVTGDDVLIAMNDGSATYLWAFTEDATIDTTIEADNLTLVGVLEGVTNLANGDLAQID